MVQAGMNAARINSSHGDFTQYKKIIKMVRSLGEIPIIVDTQGPDVRLKIKDGKGFKVENGKEILVGFNSSYDLYFNYNFLNQVKKGDMILMDDGLIEFVISRKNGKHIKLKALNDGVLRNGLSINSKAIRIKGSKITPKDRKTILFAKKMNVEYIAISFTSGAHDVKEAKKMVKGKNIAIIAKIESPEGVKNFKEILREADGIMVARGDLGVEMSLEQVPIIQKQIVKKCNQKGKLVIVATQMLDSMVRNPRPTRAEASDVANAVLDGADCIMLSNETAIGNYPVRTVQEMAKIAVNAEPLVRSKVNYGNLNGIPDTVTKAIAEMCENLPVKKIVAITKTGFTARMLSRFKFKQPILAVTADPKTARQLKMYYGVQSIVLKTKEKERILQVGNYLYKNKLADKDDLILFSAGLYTGIEKSSNLIQFSTSLHMVQDLLKHHREFLKD